MRGQVGRWRESARSQGSRSIVLRSSDSGSQPRPDAETVELGAGGNDDTGDEGLRWCGLGRRIVCAGGIGSCLREDGVESLSDGGQHCVQPHLVDVVPVLIARELDAPFAAILVCLIFPCWDDVFLKETHAISTSERTSRVVDVRTLKR